MKRILIFLLVAMGVLTSKAQIIENGENNIMWGARVAFDVNLPGKVHSNIIDDRMFRNGTGATAGAACNIFLGKNSISNLLSPCFTTHTPTRD